MNENEYKANVLVVDDIPSNISVLMEYLSRKGYRILVAEDGESAIEQVEYAKPDIILLDIMMPGMDGFETCRRLKENPETEDIPVIFMTSLTDTEDKVKGFRSGAVDYITKPIRQEEVMARINTHLKLKQLQHELETANEALERRVAERTKDLQAALRQVESLKNQLEEENVYLKEEIKHEHNFEEIVSGSQSMKIVFRQIEQVAKTDSTVLVLGETGTGKELIARAIHNLSPRQKKSLIKVNCAALPSNLIESELFGHEKGAFTGALARKIGRFELADGGTIFLDEIGDLPMDMQTKLLRVLQEGEFERLGNPSTIKVDVRVIAATNHDLEKAIDEGKFREDLFYRLNVFPIQLPPLRERFGDIPLLAKHFLKKYAGRLNKNIRRIQQGSLKMLEDYTWPGNVRELENVIERAVILADTETLTFDDTIFPRKSGSSQKKAPSSLDEAQREHILNALNSSNWIIDGDRGAAKKLDIAPSTLRDRMKKLGISRP